MAAGRQTWEIDQEIVQLTRRKEQILHDLQDPVSAGRQATLLQQLVAIQAGCFPLPAPLKLTGDLK